VLQPSLLLLLLLLQRGLGVQISMSWSSIEAAMVQQQQ
jgi:hypothetical protein